MQALDQGETRVTLIAFFFIIFRSPSGDLAEHVDLSKYNEARSAHVCDVKVGVYIVGHSRYDFFLTMFFFFFSNQCL